MSLHPIRRALLVLITMSVFASAAPAQVAPAPLPKADAKPATPQALAGDYLGSLDVGAVKLRLGLKLEPQGEGFKGVLDSIDQRAKLPIDVITLKDRILKFQIKRIDGSFEGKVAADGKSIEGKWTQGGRPLPLTFKRVDAIPTLNRPQEPKRPYPYHEEEVTVENKAAGVRLGGTLTKPNTGGPRFPAVLLITGSGQQDRDETVMGHRPFLILADHLTRAGIAVLRLDDRGAGKSTGDFLAATSDDFVADAKAAVAFLRARPDIDPARVGLLGHSEGGVTAPRVAAADPKIAFVVMLAGVGVPLDELLVRQAQDIARAMGADAAMLKLIGDSQAEAMRVLKETDDVAEIERRLRALTDEMSKSLTPEQRTAMGLGSEQAEAQLKMALSPWFRQLVRYDPAPALKKVRCPVLAICGEKDIQVAAKENLAAIKAALEAGGNRAVQIIELPGHNHLLQQCKTGTLAEYGTIEQTMSPDALKAITEWLAARVAGTARG